MINKLIIFLVRKKLHLKLYEKFRFANQKDKNDYYYFTERQLIKYSHYFTSYSNCSLNFLISDKCVIKKCVEEKC